MLAVLTASLYLLLRVLLLLLPAEEAFVADQGRKPGAIPRASRRNHRRPRSPSNRRPTHPGTYAQPHAGAGAVVGSEMLHLREVRAAATAVALMHRLHQSSLNPLTRSPRTLCQSGPGCCKAVGLARPGGMRYLVRRPLSEPTRFWRFRAGLHTSYKYSVFTGLIMNVPWALAAQLVAVSLACLVGHVLLIRPAQQAVFRAQQTLIAAEHEELMATLATSRADRAVDRLESQLANLRADAQRMGDAETMANAEIFRLREGRHHDWLLPGQSARHPRSTTQRA